MILLENREERSYTLPEAMSAILYFRDAEGRTA